MIALSAAGVTKRFGGIHALEGADLVVEEGSCHALMGENGAGKSTLAKIIAGLVTPDAGEITLFGRPVAIHGPHDAMAAGIAIVHQELLFCENLTVAENLALQDTPRRGIWVDFAAMRRIAEEWLATIGPEIRPDAVVGDLSAGQQQIVQIAGAIGRGARIILFDEPTSSLSQGELSRFFQVCDRLREDGVTCVFVSHRLAEVYRLCDQVTVLRDGKNVFAGPLAGLTEAELVQNMVGRHIESATAPQHEMGEIILDVRDLQVDRAGPPLSFSVRAGEILGLAGLVGAGRSELAQAIMGLRPADGVVQVKGKAFQLGRIDLSMSAGLGLIPEDRKRQGLAANLNVRENIALATLDKRQRAGWVDAQAEAAECKSMRDALSIKAATLEDSIGTLSGGNQQKVVIAKWLLGDSAVLILDEPTRGVDVGAKAEIHGHIRRLASEGRAILLISSDLPELLLLSDRILAMRAGRFTGETLRAGASEERLIRWMTGVNENDDLGTGTGRNI